MAILLPVMLGLKGSESLVYGQFLLKIIVCYHDVNSRCIICFSYAFFFFFFFFLFLLLITII